MDKIIKFVNEDKTYKKILEVSKEYDNIILDLGGFELNPPFLVYLLKIFRFCKSCNVGIVFLSTSDINSDLKKHFRIFKNYEEYRQMSVYTSFQIKMYINNELLRNVLKDRFVKNGFLTKERMESNFLNKEHDCRMKDIYIIDFDKYKKEKLKEINKIKSKNKETIVILLISSDSIQQALKTINLGVDSIIEKPVDINEIEETVKRLAIQSNLKYENEMLNNQIRKVYEEIENELKLAKDIQQSMLPQNDMEFNGYHISYIFEPSQGIGGDFCDVIKLSEDKLGVVFADISGHGIPASLLSSMLKVFIRSEIKDFSHTNEFIESLNEKIINIFPKGKFVSMFYAIIDTKNNKMRYCKASQEPGLMLKNGEVIELETEGQVLGVFSKKMFKDLVIFEEKEIDFGETDSMLLYTDGVTEATKNDELYGLSNLKEEFKVSKTNLQNIKYTLDTYLLEDDLTLLTIYRKR